LGVGHVPIFKALYAVNPLASSLLAWNSKGSVMPRVTLIELMALAGIVLMLAIALCVFDGGDGLNSDLCLMSLAIPTGTLIILFLALVGGLVLSPPETYRLFLADRSSPPPKA
jgi:hypothetical protein